MGLDGVRSRLGNSPLLSLENSDASPYDVTVYSSITEVEKSRWNALVERSPRGCVFHRYEWLAAVEIGLEQTACHVGVWKENNLIGIFPNFVVDIPQIPFRRMSSSRPEYGGPLVPTDADTVLPLLLDTARTQCGVRTIYHEIRAHTLDHLRYADALWFSGYRPYLERTRHLIDLTRGYDEILSRMSSNRRDALESGHNTTYELRESPMDQETLQRFYDDYKATMNRVEAPVFPLTFFEELRRLSDHIDVLSLFIEGEYIGGILDILDWQQSTIFGFKLAIKQSRDNVNGTELLIDAMIKRGLAEGMETYDLGGTRPNKEDGLFQYKDSLGSELVPVVTWERGTSMLWPLAKRGRRRHLARKR